MMRVAAIVSAARDALSAAEHALHEAEEYLTTPRATDDPDPVLVALGTLVGLPTRVRDAATVIDAALVVLRLARDGGAR